MKSILSFSYFAMVGQSPARFYATIEQTIDGKEWQTPIQKTGADADACRELCKLADEQALITLLLS